MVAVDHDPPGRPPRLPSRAIRIPHTAIVPAALSPRSRAISQRRASRASPASTTTIPNSPPVHHRHQPRDAPRRRMDHLGDGPVDTGVVPDDQQAAHQGQHGSGQPDAVASATAPLAAADRGEHDRAPATQEMLLRNRASALGTFGHTATVALRRQNLSLLPLELIGRDNAAVTQVGQLGELVGRARRACGVLDVATGVRVRLLRLLLGPLLHLAAPGDEVDQDADQRDEQHENEPQCLRPAGQVMAAEDVDEDIDQNPDPEHPEEDLEDRPERPEQRVRVGTSEWHGDPMSGNGA